MIATIRRDEVQVLLARRLMNATPITVEIANRMSGFLLDSGMVTVYTMFCDDPEPTETRKVTK